MNLNTQIVEFEQLRADIATLVEPITQIRVTDKATMDVALQHGGVIVAMKKRLQEKRDELTRPLFTRQREINAEAAKLGDILAGPERHIRDELATFRAAEDRKKREAEERLRLEREEIARREAQERENAKAILGDATPENALEQAAISEDAARAEAQAKQAAAQASVKVKGSSMVWRHEVVNPAMVPREYCSPDDSKVRAALKLGLREIPGVRIWEEVQTRLGGAR